MDEEKIARFSRSAGIVLFVLLAVLMTGVVGALLVRLIVWLWP